MKKIKSSTINGRNIKLSKDVEENEELIGKDTVENLKALRKKNPKADLSIYSIKIKE